MKFWPLIQVRRDIEHSQSRGCWLYVQIGFTGIYFINPFDRYGRWQGVSFLLKAGRRQRTRISINSRLHPKPTP